MKRSTESVSPQSRLPRGTPRRRSEILRRSFHRVSRPSATGASTASDVPPVSGVRAKGRRSSHLRDLLLFFAVCLVAVLSTACGSAVSVKAAYDPAAPFQQYRTFAMIEPNRPVPTGMDSDPFTLRQLRELTYQALVARGFRAVPMDQADLIVGVLARFQQQVDVSSVGGPYTGAYDYRYYGYGPRYGGPWGGFGMTYGPTVTKYDEMQVAIDLIDPKKNEVRWRGYGARRADKQLNAAQLQEMIERILSQYPPGQSGKAQ